MESAHGQPPLAPGAVIEQAGWFVQVMVWLPLVKGRHVVKEAMQRTYLTARLGWLPATL